tara:strand:+ start:60 stop:437 length:378 start_codon:yes stop_codon:yes gene_type:complete
MGESNKLSDQIIIKFGRPFQGSDIHTTETYSGFSAFADLSEKDQTITSLADCILHQFPIDESVIDRKREITRNIFGSSTYAVALEFSESEDYKNLSSEVKDYISSRGGIWTNGGHCLREVFTEFC